MTSLAILYRRVQKEKKATNYCIHGLVARYGPRNQLQGVKKVCSKKSFFGLF